MANIFTDFQLITQKNSISGVRWMDFQTIDALKKIQA